MTTDTFSPTTNEDSPVQRSSGTAAKVTIQSSKVIFSGNSARYSPSRMLTNLKTTDLEAAGKRFRYLTKVAFNEDGKVSIHHEGDMTPGVRSDLRKLGQVLESGEILVAMGIENTIREAILVSISEIGVEVLPVIIKPTSKDAFRKRSFIHRLSKVIHLETTWFKSGPRTNPQLPRSLGAIDPSNAGYNLFHNNVE